jgi:hypothetical protein
MSYQVLSSGVENAMEVAVQVMSTVLDRILLQFEVPLRALYLTLNQLFLFLQMLVIGVLVSLVLSNLLHLLFRIGSQDSFTFPPYHQKMMDPYNYYMFGQNYVRPLLNFRWVE